MTPPSPTSSKPKSSWGDLGVRIASAFVMIPLALGCNWLGGLSFKFFIFALGLVMAYEWCAIVFKKEGLQYLLFGCAVVCAVFSPEIYGTGIALLEITLIAFCSALLTYRQSHSPKKFWRYVGVFYISLPLIALIMLRNDDVLGAYAILWLFVIVWSADIMAYFSGRLIGGPKLAPRISPSKTWAGLFGAMVGSAVASLIFSFSLGLPGPMILASLAALLAIVEQGGDLFESSLKRNYGVKDSGRLIPGHGGALDRVDGLAAAAVAATVIAVLHGGGAHLASNLLIW